MFRFSREESYQEESHRQLDLVRVSQMKDSLNRFHNLLMLNVFLCLSNGIQSQYDVKRGQHSLKMLTAIILVIARTIDMKVHAF